MGILAVAGRPSAIARIAATIAALCVVGLGAGCKPDAPSEEPLRHRVERDEHDDSLFPMEHGIDENPKRDCDICHGAFDTFTEFDCLPCHTHDRQDSDRTHRRIPGYEPVSRSCLGCHPMGDAEGLDHEAVFPIAAGPHAEVGCGDCHLEAGPGGSYESFTCVECHDHAEQLSVGQHGRVPDFEWTTERCFACHPDGASAGRDHDQRFLIRSGPHVETPCAGCHLKAGEPDYSAHTCVDCHDHVEQRSVEQHVRVADFEWTTERCRACHPDGKALGGDHDARFPIRSGPHAETLCAGCHPAAGANDYEPHTCVDCHDHDEPSMAEVHAGIDTYRWTTEACRGCHPTGEGYELEDHNDLFPIGPGTAHHEQQCADCHPRGFRDYTCVECHPHARELMEQEHARKREFEWDSPRCKECHPDGKVMTAQRHGAAFPLRGDHRRLTCQQCHPNPETYFDYICIECHTGEHTCNRMDREHRELGNRYYCTNAYCLRCHEDGRADD